MGLTVLVFLGQELGYQFLGGDILYSLGCMSVPDVLSGQYWRLITPVFLHLGWLHIGINMYSLYVLGPGLERQFGHSRFLALYLIAGFAGNALSFMFLPLNTSSAGASTALFGLIGAEGVFVYQNRQMFGNRTGAILRNILFIAAINLLFGFYTASPIANANVPTIDNWGHIGGLLGGLLFAWFAGPIWQVEGLYPNLHVADQREPIHVQLTAVGVSVLFAAVALFRILRG
ncbi:MAG TPA: rhomboid family intramembrane serine protease [Anaerolineaceae bacterium]